MSKQKIWDALMLDLRPVLAALPKFAGPQPFALQVLDLLLLRGDLDSLLALHKRAALSLYPDLRRVLQDYDLSFLYVSSSVIRRRRPPP